MLETLVREARSCRRFDEEKSISLNELESLVDLGRLSPNGGNRQYLRYAVCNNRKTNQEIYQCLGWAAYFSDWDGPKEGERPAAYIVLLRDRTLQENISVDEGIAAQSIFLGAREMGYGGCMLMNVKRERLLDILKLDPEKYAVSMVIALGAPKEEIQIVPVGKDGSIRYYRDENQIHYVPKRSLAEVLVREI